MARDPAWRFDQADAMRAALVGPHHAPIPVRPGTRVMTAPLPALTGYTPAGLEPDPSRRKLWIAAIVALFVLALMLFMLDPPFSSPPPTPVDTTTPVPTPTTSFTTTTPSSTEVPPPPPRHGGPGKKGKARGGGEGD
jgi:serine/threonine-protein kinase